MEGEPKVPEGVEATESKLEQAIQEAQNIDELYAVLREAGSIETTRETLTAEQVIEDIDGIRSLAAVIDKKQDMSKHVVFRSITRNNGLRDKVKELVAKEQ